MSICLPGKQSWRHKKRSGRLRNGLEYFIACGDGGKGLSKAKHGGGRAGECIRTLLAIINEKKPETHARYARACLSAGLRSGFLQLLLGEILRLDAGEGGKPAFYKACDSATLDKASD